MAEDDKMIEYLESHIAQLEGEAVNAKKVLNGILVRSGQPPRYADAALEAGGGRIASITKDTFYGMSLISAMRQFLDMRRAAKLGPATPSQVYEALDSGGFKFETENIESRKRNIRGSLTKNTAVFHRLPNGNDFGLCSWYEGIESTNGADEKPKKPKGKKKTAKKARVAVEPKQKAPPAAAKATVTTMVGAVRAALESFPGEFTKQGVVDWIAKNHPELKPEVKKPSILSMMANLKKELGIETVYKGNGTEPHRFRIKKETANKN